MQGVPSPGGDAASNRPVADETSRDFPVDLHCHRVAALVEAVPTLTQSTCALFAAKLWHP
jgi:hypothetical protein